MEVTTKQNIFIKKNGEFYMKKIKKLSNAEVADFCNQLALLFSAGIPPYEAIVLMQEDIPNEQGKEILSTIHSHLKEGLTFYESLKATDVFPDYVTEMILLGEETGNLDIITQKLAEYYDRQCQIFTSIKNALSYPLIMVTLMLLILIVLLSKVLPLFNQIFIQLGSELSNMAKQLMSVGSILQSFIGILLVFIVLIGILFALLFSSEKYKKHLYHFLQTKFFTRNFFLQIAYSRFAACLSLVTTSGIDIFQGLVLADQLISNDIMSAKIKQCKSYLSEGDFIYEALKKADIFKPSQLRMLQIAYKSGNSDVALTKISDTYENDMLDKIRHLLGMIEPTLVIAFSVIVGIILLSVILPLIGMMSNIG